MIKFSFSDNFNKLGFRLRFKTEDFNCWDLKARVNWLLSFLLKKYLLPK